MTIIDARLRELGINLPEHGKSLANYVSYVHVGNLVFTSGQLPLVNGKLGMTGPLRANAGVEQAQAQARICFVNILSHLKMACGGDLDRIARIVKLSGFIACTAEFADHPKVLNGASDLCVEIFGDRGRHARTTVGVASLPLQAVVEVDAIVEIH
jgi:enamine deaminase RidA (YjgF/YER057c/UK114 family)